MLDLPFKATEFPCEPQMAHSAIRERLSAGNLINRHGLIWSSIKSYEHDIT